MSELSLHNCRLDKRYDVLGKLGRGSYAEIFLAKDTLSSPRSPHNTVVLKALNVFLQDDLDEDLERTLVENFQNEAIALDRVRHPNILSRLGHGTARDLKGTVFHYLVLEYMPGGDLHKYSRDITLSVNTLFRYLEQVCAGLKFAHQNGVIHRDIKPQNLLLSKDYTTVKIADFGVARLSNLTSPITRVGTNIYAPPEHSPLNAGAMALENASLTFASDIYSLAKSFYTLFTGEVPRYFANKKIDRLPISCEAKPWATDFLKLIIKATDDEPAKRYQTIDEFWADAQIVRSSIDEEGMITNGNPRFVQNPQPHISRGYNPIIPTAAKFNSSKELNLKDELNLSGVSTATIPAQRYPYIPPKQDNTTLNLGREGESPNVIHDGKINIEIVPQQKRGKGLRNLSILLISLMLMVGALFATHSYLASKGGVTGVLGLSDNSSAKANTDVNLRTEPGTSNSPIGIVTKNSKVKIIDTSNNWYQIDIIEQGRQPDSPNNSDRGWVNGRYIDVVEN